MQTQYSQQTLTQKRTSVGKGVSYKWLVIGSMLASMLPTGLHAAQCSFDVSDNWNAGFKTEIVIFNDGDAFNDWTLNLSWNQGVTLSNGWNGNYDCNESGCTITPPSHSPTINSNQRYELGFVANKNGVIGDIQVELSGDVCDGSATNTDGTGGDSSMVNADASLWHLNGTASTVQYVSVKKDHTAENNRFSAVAGADSALSGSIDSQGNVIFAIDLNDVQTGVDIRNSRLIDLLFENEYLGTAYFTTQIDIDAVAAMASGTSAVQTVSGELSLHGIRQTTSAQVLVVKLASDKLSVSTLQPILVDSKNFDMAYGIEALRVVAGLSSIGEVVPVYLNLLFDAQSQASFDDVDIPSEPIEPTGFAAQYNDVDAQAELSWQDNSNNETLYIVRRKSIDGDWHTTGELASNASQFVEGLPETGEFDYKVIAVNNSVPSLSSSIQRVTVTETDQIARGMETYAGQCAGCHGTEGGGLGTFPALNTERDVAAMIDIIVNTMPYGNAGACDQKCAEDVAAYIQTLWEGEIFCDINATPIAYGARQLKVLTQTKYQNTVEDLLGVDYTVSDGLSADTKVGFFTNNTRATVQSTAYNNYLLVAEELAQWAADNDFAPALSCAAIDTTCAEQLVNDLAPQIFRRPLTVEENDNYLAIANGTFNSGDVKAGMQLALEGLLASPQFIYRHELGEANPANPELDADAFELTSYEMATFLAYTFTGTTPDQVLLDAAANDELRDETNIISHANRLAAGADSVLGDFIGSWLGTADLEVAAKDESVWPGFAQLVPHMKAELNKTFAYVMTQPDESFDSLYTANYTFVNEALANHYGLTGVIGEELQKVDTTERGGILANGAFMSRWAEPVESHPVLRSVRVRRRMLCQEQLDPPAGTFEAREAKLAELSEFLQDPSTTNRLKYHRLTEGSPCTNCHTQYINPLGFGMEDFDSVGNIRSNDLNGNVIDASGELFAPEDYANLSEVIGFTGTRELGSVIAGLDSAQSCLPKQMFRYVMGVGHEEIDPANPEGAKLADTEKAGYACEVENLTDAMMNQSPRAMLENFGFLKAVRYRKAWSRD